MPPVQSPAVFLPYDMMICCSSHVTQRICSLQPQDPTFDQAKQVMGWALVAYFLCWTLSPFFQPKVRRRHHTVVLLSRFLKVLVGEPHLPAVTMHELQSGVNRAKIWHLHKHGLPVSCGLPVGYCPVTSRLHSPCQCLQHMTLTANSDSPCAHLHAVCEIARVMSFAVVHLLQPACAQPASQLPPSDAPAHSSWWNAYGLTDAAAKRIPKVLLLQHHLVLAQALHSSCCVLCLMPSIRYVRPAAGHSQACCRYVG